MSTANKYARRQRLTAMLPLLLDATPGSLHFSMGEADRWRPRRHALHLLSERGLPQDHGNPNHDCAPR